MAGGRLKSDPLFLGLARPPTILGVSYKYFVINALLTMLIFINTKSFYSFPFGVVIHFFGVLVCLKEPRAIELWLIRMRYGYWNLWNRPYHSNTNSYDPF